MSNLSKILIIIFTLSLLDLESKAIFKPDRLFVKNINLAEGLSQCVVTDMAIDSKGFLWAGTFDGLNRFDGSTISTFRHNPEDSSSLPSSKILKIFSDKNGHLWLQTANGFSVFNTQTGKTISPSILKTITIEGLCNNDENSVWVYAKGKGLILINTTNFTSENTSISTSLANPNEVILDIYKIKSMIYVLSSNADILEYNTLTKSSKIYHTPNQHKGFYNISGLDKSGSIYFGSADLDMIYFNTQEKSYNTSSFYFQNIKLVSVNAIRFDSINNILLISSYGQGIFIYDYDTKELKQYKKNDSELKIANNYPLCILNDNQGVLYVGYDGSGIDVFDPFIKKFSAIKKLDNNDNESFKFIRKIVEVDPSTILVGTSGSGLVKYNRIDKSFKFFNLENKATNFSNFIIEMLRVGNQIWVGYNGSGIGIYDIQTIKPIAQLKIGSGPTELSNGTIWSFLDDKKGSIWIGTRENGLNKYNTATKQIKQFDRFKYPLFANNGLRCMTQLQNGTILIGTEKGLLSVNPLNDSITLVYPKIEDKNNIQSIKSIYEDKKHRIWLGTDGDGIIVLNSNYAFLKFINSSNSLNNNVVYSLLPQNDTSLWISTNAGLTNIIWNENSLQKNGTVRAFNYDESNGLQSNEFNTGAYAILQDGSMAFGGLNGVNIFKGDEIKNNPVLPKVYINEFKVFENPLKTEILVPYLKEINLNHYENSFSISFNTIGFTLSGKTKFKYRLVGYENEWIDAGSRSYKSYTNMKSGEYEFQVMACNYDGIWNNDYTSLKIRIATPFYKTWWFIGLVILLLAQLAYLFYRYRMKLIKINEEIKIQHTKEIAEVEMKALRAQINPHFLFNSLNSINSYILKNDNRLASKYLIKFSQLVRNILNNSSSQYITLQEELQTIELYMLIEGMRFNNQFSYEIIILDDMNTANIAIPSLLLQPYVENAIWHGLLHKEGDKKIVITISKTSSEMVSITIDDNGVGRAMAIEIEQKPRHHKSFGMELGRSRLRLMNSMNNEISTVDVIDKLDNENTPLGTTIKIIIPSTMFNKETESFITKK